MPASFQEILNSNLFKFVVGETADGSPSEFFVHQDAIAQLSKPLHVLTKGELPEARAGCATWKDVNKETFERFAQFAYTGDYSIPKTEKRDTVVKREKPQLGGIAHPSSPPTSNGTRRRNNSHESTSTVDPQDRSVPVLNNGVCREPLPENTDDEPGNVLTSPSSLNKKNKKKKKTKTVDKATLPEQEPEPKLAQPESEPADPEAEPGPVELELVEPEPAEPTPVAGREKSPEHLSPILTADFQSLSYPLLASRDNYYGTCEPAADFAKDHSYSNVLLSHASLYVLGDVQLIDSLQALALFKLHKTLCAFQLSDENIGDITDLARYAYSKESSAVGGLRGLVCQYMAIHAVELAVDVGFMNLLAGGGQIVKDFFRFQLQRIH